MHDDRCCSGHAISFSLILLFNIKKRHKQAKHKQSGRVVKDERRRNENMHHIHNGNENDTLYSKIFIHFTHRREHMFWSENGFAFCRYTAAFSISMLLNKHAYPSTATMYLLQILRSDFPAKVPMYFRTCVCVRLCAMHRRAIQI